MRPMGKIELMDEEETVAFILDKYSEWIEAYGLNPYQVASYVLAKELKTQKEKAEIYSYVENAR